MNSSKPAGWKSSWRGKLAVLAGLLFIAGANVFNTSESKPMPTTSPVEVRVGEHGESFARRNPTIGHVDRQPAGLNFYKIHWPVTAMGAVIIRHGKLEVPVAHVLRVTGTEDMDYLSEGLSDIKINFALSNSERISHDEARLKTLAFVQKIHHAGWKILIPRNSPRIRGKDMSDYLLNFDQFTSLDPSYVPSFNEWMRYEDLTGWEFYSDHVFLKVQLSREHTLTDPKKPGVYLLSITLQSENEHFRDYVDGADRRRWKEMLQPEIAAMNQSRATAESRVKSLGISIDTTYIDPPVPDLVGK